MPIKDFPSYISKSEAIKLIAERTKPHYEDLRKWKNKIDGQIKTRIKNGLIRQNDGLLYSADIAKSMRKLTQMLLRIFRETIVRKTPVSRQL